MSQELVIRLGMVLLGSLFGAVLCLAASAVFGGPSAGMSFESLDDLRAAITVQDSRDVKKDRSVSLRSIIVPHASDTIIYTLRPNLDVKFQGVHVRTNSAGMRGPEFAVAKPRSVFRVALLGDSFAFGWGVDEKSSFAAVLQSSLSEKIANKKIEVLNFGVPGYSTFQEVALFEEKGVVFQPDAVLVYYVENDADLPFFIRNINEPDSVIPGSVFARRLWRKDDDLIRRQHGELVEMLDPNRALAKLAELAKHHHFSLLVAVNPGKKAKADIQRLRPTLRRPDVKFIPLQKRLAEWTKQRGLNAGDLRLPNDPHPNAAKHAILGELLARSIYKEIKTTQANLLR